MDFLQSWLLHFLPFLSMYAVFPIRGAFISPPFEFGGEGNRTWKKWRCVTYRLMSLASRSFHLLGLHPPHNKTQARSPQDDQKTLGEREAQPVPSHSTHPTHSSYSTRHVAIPCCHITICDKRTFQLSIANFRIRK